MHWTKPVKKTKQNSELKHSSHLNFWLESLSCLTVEYEWDSSWLGNMKSNTCWLQSEPLRFGWIEMCTCTVQMATRPFFFFFWNIHFKILTYSRGRGGFGDKVVSMWYRSQLGGKDTEYIIRGSGWLVNIRSVSCEELRHLKQQDCQIETDWVATLQAGVSASAD